MAVFDATARPWRLLLLVAVVTAVLALVNVAVIGDGPDWNVDTIASVSPPGQDTRLGMYTRVISGHLDARQLDPSLRDRFADLADRRLHQQHGVGLRDPGAAALLGSEVTARPDRPGAPPDPRRDRDLCPTDRGVVDDAH